MNTEEINELADKIRAQNDMFAAAANKSKDKSKQKNEISIQISGGEKSGKSTLARLLAAFCHQNGFEYELTDEDGGNEFPSLKEIAKSVKEKSKLYISTNGNGYNSYAKLAIPKASSRPLGARSLNSVEIDPDGPWSTIGYSEPGAIRYSEPMPPVPPQSVTYAATGKPNFEFKTRNASIANLIPMSEAEENFLREVKLSEARKIKQEVRNKEALVWMTEDLAKAGEPLF